MLDETVMVNTAAVDAPGASLVPSWSQLKVIYSLAPVGVQLLVDILNVNETPVPMFLTYTVLVTVLPDVIVPQSMDVMLVVHWLSEYTPRFGVTVIEPLEDKFWLAVAPKVVIVRANAVITNAITANVGNFRLDISCFIKPTCIVSLTHNKVQG